ncbi:MAG: hypothetical protein HGA23_04260 [Bacteroidales bacterium]|nr:hypothetical protein [Bacteroidales bacterium]
MMDDHSTPGLELLSRRSGPGLIVRNPLQNVLMKNSPEHHENLLTNIPMATPDKKGSARPAPQGTERKEKELVQIRKALEVQAAEILGYKTELGLALDKIASLEDKIVRLRQSGPFIDVSASKEALAPIDADPELIELKVTPIDFKRPSIAIPHNQPFKVCFAITLPMRKRENQPPLPCRVSVFAKQLGSGTRMKIGETETIIEESENIQACLLGNALQTGTYRFEVQAVLDIPGKSTPYVARLDDGLINVY